MCKDNIAADIFIISFYKVFNKTKFKDFYYETHFKLTKKWRLTFFHAHAIRREHKFNRYMKQFWDFFFVKQKVFFMENKRFSQLNKV